jgi:AcrR family transcriptional regulator
MTREDRRRQIMQAAEKLFSGGRFHEITTDEVARAAGVGKGTMYRYFRDKDDLFFQTAMAGFDELCELLHERVAQAAPFSEQILAACREIVRFFEGRLELFRMMQSEDFRVALSKGAVYGRWMEHRKRLISVLADILHRGVDESQVRRDVPPEVLANFLLGMLRTRVRDLQGAPAAARRLELVMDLFRSGAGKARQRRIAGSRGGSPHAPRGNGACSRNLTAVGAAGAETRRARPQERRCQQ